MPRKGHDNRGNGVAHIQTHPLFGDDADVISNGGGIHPQLDTKADHHSQIPVLGGTGGDDDTKSQSQKSQLQNQKGKQQNTGIGLYAGGDDQVIDPEAKEKEHLDSKGDQLRKNSGDGHNQTGEIDLPENAGIADKCIGCMGQATGKQRPHDCAA